MIFEKDIEQWPEEGIEHISKCPICGSESRKLLHDGLRDYVFFCAPGVWTMWRCDECRSGYLDPRPTVETIGEAYNSYYTHAASSRSVQGVGKWGEKYEGKRFAFLRKRIGPAYLNSVYGHDLDLGMGPFNVLSRLMSPKNKYSWQHRIRHLPSPGRGDELLDIGCGNGEFLAVARDLGYRVTGIEIDDNAIEVASQTGFDVIKAALPHTSFEANRFQQITLNHVIEHLHDPMASLSEICRLLKPGGRLWIRFPNIDARGHEIYGAAWRGLEPPRHLVMPSYQGAITMLINSGFDRVKMMLAADSVKSYFDKSDKIRQSMEADDKANKKVSKSMRKAASEFERKNPKSHEQLTFVAFKK